MTKTLKWFDSFWEQVAKTSEWREMAATVEDSPWHREANVAVHTTMCIEHYIRETAPHRTDREQMLTLMTLLFHDFGKPEAEEVLDKKDGSGQYRRYAGHEPKSANAFLSFMMSHEKLRNEFFDQGFDWADIRKIKFMIEHHLPFGLKNPTKVANLRRAVIDTLGADETCFYDQLWSDCSGRISDDHFAKRAAVIDWIKWFQSQAPSARPKTSEKWPFAYVLVGPVGVGKSTWTNKFRRMNPSLEIIVVSEDSYRMDFYRANLSATGVADMMGRDVKQQYADAWQFCFDHSSDYNKYAKMMLDRAVKSGKTLVIDRTNQTRKSRSPWITAARSNGYRICTIEFFCSEELSHGRQSVRPDKAVPSNRVHQIYMTFEVPWLGVETDTFEIVPTF